MIANVDPREVERFADLAARWWDPRGALRTLHEINPLRLRYIDERAGLAGATVLDVGCGGGILSEGMAALGARVTGIDASTAALDVARLHGAGSGHTVEYLHTTAEALAASAGRRFRIVTCLELLEHVPDPVSLVAACAALVEDGGHVFFSTINRNPRAWLLAVVGAEYLLGLLPRGTHDYARFVKPSELDAWARAAGLRLHEARGLRYDPFGGRHRLTRSLDVNYLAWLRAGDA